MMSKGVPDILKGSYYNNPLFDKPFDDPELITKYPSFCQPNLWPTENLPELEHAFKALGHKIVEVGILVAKQCDKFVNKTYPGAGKLEEVVTHSKTPKARLLHYFPLPEPKDQVYGNNKDSWCGWHNDHGSLTGLVPAMYFDKDGNEIPCPDQEAGLYIKARNQDTQRIVIPGDFLAFQIGEAAQIVSGGVLQATPHCVRGPQGKMATETSRDTYVVFMEPMWDFDMSLPKEITNQKELTDRWEQYLPGGVPVLSSRWNPTMDFGVFAESCVKAYYGY